MSISHAFIFRYLAIILLGYAVSRSPLMMKSVPPAPGKPWADGPMALIPTPQQATPNTDDVFVTGATHMCLLHNAILRGYNSIYHQAAHIKDGDKADFVGYALTWHKFVQSHHDDEEANLFTMIEKVLADNDVFAETHKEHDSFLTGLTNFHTYLSTLPSAADFSGSKLLSIMATFETPFATHFRNEISTIAALASHPQCPANGSPEAASASASFAAWGKKTVSKAGIADVVPFFLTNLDGDFEDGAWRNWPPMPKPVRWGLVNIAGAWNGRQWRFSSCDGAGRRRDLYAAVASEQKTAQGKDRQESGGQEEL